MSVVASVIFGFILLLAVTMAIPSTERVLRASASSSRGSGSRSMGQNWADVLLFICVVAQFFCLTASVTSASRMLFAFSRDRAVPGHQLWRRVSRNRVPHNAVMAIVRTRAAILMLPAIWNYFVGYSVGTAIAVIGLYIAFILPVILRYRMRRRFEPGAWTLGEHYKWIDPIAIVWVALHLDPVLPDAALLRVRPWKDEFTWEAVNYAPPSLAERCCSSAAGGCSRPQVVQGAGPPGHRGRARADRGAVRASAQAAPAARLLTIDGRGPRRPAPVTSSARACSTRSRAASAGASSRTPSGTRSRTA